MTPYYEDVGVAVHHGDCLDVMAELPAASVDTVITDPPYGLSFMGREWDHGVPGVPFWEAALRVAKPGAMLLAFGGTRTYHRLTCCIEDAGWEIRDCLMWMYGQGFPKSADISKAIEKDEKPCAHYPGQHVCDWCRNSQRWSGWGTTLKSAWEPIILAMKPLDGTFGENALRHGVAGLNIDGGRIGTSRAVPASLSKCKTPNGVYGEYGGGDPKELDPNVGRWPANVIMDDEAGRLLDEQTGTLTSGEPAGIKAGGKLNCFGTFAGGIPVTGYGDSGGASRFFYCAKASPSERGDGNKHPTVKPLDLMRYLARLTKTPTGGVVLDPFAGSHTTALACIAEGRPVITIERELPYVETGVGRIKAATHQRPLFAIGSVA